MTEFRIEVVKLGAVEKHPNADKLSITQVNGGYPCIVANGDFKEGDLAVYIPVDALVPTSRPEFAFLSKDAGVDGFARIKARRLRGVFSMGLLIPAPKGVKAGDDCQQMLGIGKWLPPAEREPVPKVDKRPWWNRKLAKWFPWAFAKRRVPGPKVPYYDIEGMRRHKHLFQYGEDVVVTEKIHGAQFRAVFTGGRFYIGSRTVWGRPPESEWGIVAAKYDLATKLREFPDMVLFGEVCGNVQDLKYGLPNSVDLMAFDALALKPNAFLDWSELSIMCHHIGVPMVPPLYRGPWKPELAEMSEGPSTVAGAKHIREGIVVKPAKERIDPHFGRVILKLPGEGYLTRKGA